MIIKFKNWEKFQNRKIENTQWFRFENKIIYHDLWDELAGDEFKCFVFMLCEASLNKNSGIYRMNDRTDSRKSGLDKKVFDRTIKILKRLQVVEIRTTHGCYTDVSSAITTLHNNTEQDITEQNNILLDSPSAHQAKEILDFERIYAKYPRKIGKQRGMKICKAQIKTPGELESLSLAVDRYVRHLTLTGTESRFIKHFSTFMNEWRDWLDPNIGEVSKIEQIKPKTRLTAADLSD